MYIGSTGPRGLHHLVYEVVDNSVDEALQGHCDSISVTLQPDGRGEPKTKLVKGEKAAETGTTITFLPDGEIFEETDFSFETLAQRMREMAFLTKGLRIALSDERAGGESVVFQFEGGIRDFIA